MHVTGLGWIVGHKVVWIRRYLCINISNDLYVCVTGLGCIIRHNVGMSNKIFMYECKMFVYIHVTGLGYIRLCDCKRFVYMFVTGLGCIVLHEVVYVLGCIIGHYVVWVIRHSNMYMSETRLYHIVRECATELVTRHLCMNMSKGLYMYMSQG